MANWFLCSMGANLQPEYNFAEARRALIKLGQAHYSVAIYTKPVAMQSAHDFLNALFILHTELDSVRLKQQFNALEQQLGRDRSDPHRALKDRPMDIDIIGQLNPTEAAAVWLQVPDYLATTRADLQQLYNQLEMV